MKSLPGQLSRVVLLVLAAGLASAILVRYSPGSLVDEREINQKLGESSLAALREQQAAKRNVGTAFVSYLKGVVHGDLGYSASNNAPIGALIADRAPTTLRELVIGLAGGWLFALGLAVPAGRFRRAWGLDFTSSSAAGLLLCLPAALIAYLCLVAGAKASVALIVVVAPRIFLFSRNLLVQAYNAMHVETARARGVGEMRILWAHVLPGAAPQMLALVAVSASVAIGAAIPIEAILDVPGLGRLAWQAAMARDITLLISLTALVAIVTTSAFALSETIQRSVGAAE